MKYLYYLKLFFFISLNWNIRLALFTVYHEIRGERKYKINTSKIEQLQNFHIKGSNIDHAEIYQGANYYLLEKIFDHLQTIEANQNILDYGCGKGRVLTVAPYYGFTKLTGVEFAKELCETARKNISEVQQKFPAKIFNVIHVDAVEYLIENDTNVFFFFNPFDEIVMLRIVKNILMSIKAFPREAYIVYINPVHKEIFMSAGFEQIYFFEKLKYVQVSIMMLSTPGMPEDV